MYGRNGLKLTSLWWRHNGPDSVPNLQPHDCLLNRLFRRRSKKTSKLRVTGLCAGNSPVTGEFPAQMASNPENVSIWWRHHVLMYPDRLFNWLYFGPGLLIFLIFLILVVFQLSETSQICSFQAFYWDCMEGIGWNLPCWCILTILRTDLIFVMVC